MLYRDYFEVETQKGIHKTDVTREIKRIVSDCKIKNGLCHIFVTGTTAGFTLNEACPMLVQDFKKFFSVVDEKGFYHHPQNAFSHLRANLTKQDLTIALSEGELMLGDFQSILLWEFDIKPRRRKIVVTINGE
jgi:secondary thiamine-phosphate synthase enzyme